MISEHDIPPAAHMGDIRYLRRQEIDIRKWDHCIQTASNGLIYARSFYLDHMTAGQWDALVLNDYEAVMPLAWNRKWGIRYLYQPPFTQQLGIFSGARPQGAAIGASLLRAFLTTLDRHFRFAEIFLNYDNPYPGLKAHTNFILELDSPYPRLFDHYKNDLLRNLKLAERNSMQYRKDFDLALALALYKDRYRDRTPHVKENAWERFEKLCFHLREKEQCVLRAVAGMGGETLATALFLVGEGRMHLLQSTSLPAGRQAEANHFLLDKIIEEFSGQPLILDFEGSDLAGIAHFYSNFGSRDQPYYFYRHNRLPWPIRLFK